MSAVLADFQPIVGRADLAATVLVSAHPAVGRFVRRHTEFVLREWGIPQATEDAQSVLMEYLQNAIRHTTSVKVSITLQVTILTWPGASIRALLLEVSDTGDPLRPGTHPQTRDTSPDDEDGRGLLIVNALSAVAWTVLDNPGHRRYAAIDLDAR